MPRTPTGGGGGSGGGGRPAGRAPAAPEITVTGTWCACGMRLSHPNEEVRVFLYMRARVKESGGGVAKREGTGNSQEQNIQLFVTFLRLIPP